MPIKSFSLVSLLLLLWSIATYGQNPDNYRTFQVPVVYRLPPGQNGLTESGFQLAVSIRMERYPTYSEAVVNIRPTQSTAQNPKPSYLHSYTYQGQRYGDQHLGPAAFVPVRARNLQYEIKFSTSSHPLITKSREDGMDNLFGPLDKNLKASEITLYISVVGASFDNTSQIEERIRALSAPTAAPATRAAAPAASAPAAAPRGGAAAGSSSTGPSPAGTASTSSSRSGSSGTGARGTATTEAGATTTTRTTTTTATRPPAMTQQQAEQYAKDYLARDAASRQAKADAAVAKDPLIQGLGALGAMMERDAEEKAAARQLAREQRAREEEAAEAAAAEAARKRNLAAERLRLLGSYGDGKVPLTSQTIAGNELYFFSWSYAGSTFTADAPTLYVTNVFPVARYGDGTWPFTKQLLADIAKATNKSVSELSGFYTTQAEAEERLASLTDRAQELGLVVERLTFKGKPSTGGSGADFWGNAPAKATPAHQPATARPAATTDYWGNPTKPAGAPAPAATGQKPKAPTAKTNYWGNPIK